MKTIAVAQQKGGTGKTTSAHAIGVGLAMKGKSVLFIDLDGQRNLTFTMKALNHTGATAADLLEKTAAAHGTKVFKTKIRECIALAEAVATQTDIFSYAPKSTAAQDYTNLLTEI